MVFSKSCIAVIILSLGLTGCGMDNMTTTQQALLAGSAVAAVGGIAYGVHKKHEAEKEKHKHHDDNANHARRHHYDEECYDGDWGC